MNEELILKNDNKQLFTCKNDIISDLYECKYCLVLDKKDSMVYPCKCKGHMKYVHSNCLTDWIRFKNKTEIFDDSYICELCMHKIKYSRKYKLSIIHTISALIKNILTDRILLCNTTIHLLMMMFLAKRMRLIIKDYYRIYQSKSYFNLLHNSLIFLSICIMIYDAVIYYKQSFQNFRGEILNYVNLDS